MKEEAKREPRHAIQELRSMYAPRINLIHPDTQYLSDGRNFLQNLETEHESRLRRTRTRSSLQLSPSVALGRNDRDSPLILVPIRILHKPRQHLTPRLQQRMAHHDLHEPLQTLPPMLNHIITESIREDFAWQWRDCNSC